MKWLKTKCELFLKGMTVSKMIFNKMTLYIVTWWNAIQQNAIQQNGPIYCDFMKWLKTKCPYAKWPYTLLLMKLQNDLQKMTLYIVTWWNDCIQNDILKNDLIYCDLIKWLYTKCHYEKWPYVLWLDEVTVDKMTLDEMTVNSKMTKIEIASFSLWGVNLWILWQWWNVYANLRPLKNFKHILLQPLSRNHDYLYNDTQHNDTHRKGLFCDT